MQFSGRKDEDAEEFLDRFKESRSFINVPDAELLTVLPFFLDGIALNWFRYNSDKWATFSEFVPDLRRRFLDTNFQQARLNEARRRTQGPNEPVADYMTCLREMFQRLVPRLARDMELDMAWRNMAPQIQLQIDVNDMVDFDDLERTATAKEKGMRTAKEHSITTTARPPGRRGSPWIRSPYPWTRRGQPPRHED